MKYFFQLLKKLNNDSFKADLIDNREDASASNNAGNEESLQLQVDTFLRHFSTMEVGNVYQQARQYPKFRSMILDFRVAHAYIIKIISN